MNEMPSVVRPRPNERQYEPQVQVREVPMTDAEAMRRLEREIQQAPLRQMAGILQHISYGHMMEMATMLEKDKPDVMTPEAIAAWLHRWACETNGDLS